MKRFVSFVFVIFVAYAVSGCLFDSDDDKEVKKGVVKGKVSMIVTGDPVANVRVYLVNMDAKIDTVDYANNQKAFVDSALTNVSGEYVLNNVGPGKYAVVPVTSSTDTVSVYRFTPAKDSGPYEFSMNGETRTVNFAAEKVNYPGATTTGDYRIDIILAPDGTDSKFNVYYRTWILFIPYWDGPYTYYKSPNYDTIIFGAPYGFTTLLLTHDNYYKFELLSNGDTFEIGYPLINPPVYSKYEWNKTTKTLTRLE